MVLLHNMAVYMECLPLEGGPWNSILSLFDVFFRSLPGMLPSDITDMADAFRIIACVLKIPGLSQQKVIHLLRTNLDPESFLLQNLNVLDLLFFMSFLSLQSILEPFSKIISFTIQNCSFKLNHLMDLCLLCNRAFTKVSSAIRYNLFEMIPRSSYI